MNDYDKNKYLQQNQILHIVKIASLFFSATAFFQYYFMSDEFYYFSSSDAILLLSVLSSILVVYVLWNILRSKGQGHYIFTTWIEPSIFLAISFLSIILTGTYKSNYKFLFLFVIISSSIECSMRTGLIISGISSSVILGIDLIFAPQANVNTSFESDLVLACAFIIISWTIGFYVSMERRHIASLKELVNLDGLTGLYNHRYFYDSLTENTNECKINNTTLALLFIDIDYFKNYNDLNGHQKGDEVLKIISAKLKEYSRGKDIVSRYGGEEFAIIMPEASEQEALEVAEKLRLVVQEQYFSGQEYMPNKNLTISVGVSVYPTKAKSVIEIVKYADEALYRAKFLRKNRVESYFSILDDLQNDINENDKEIITSIKTLIAVINARDKYTFRHVERVVSYCTLMADRLKFEDKIKKVFIYAAYMHDIGKINISQEILNKSTPLTDEEWEILKNHPKNGAEIIKNVSVLKDVVPIILQHHEHYDGSGYPNKLKGNEISYLARLLTIIDSFDAMTSNRPYQKKKSFSTAFDELNRCSGTQFDADIVEIFIKILKEDYDN
jgi:diguanylate cyclase (GGDEF)-like protein/putative nucleotidyltransferase with HDIG domain